MRSVSLRRTRREDAVARWVLDAVMITALAGECETWGRSLPRREALGSQDLKLCSLREELAQVIEDVDERVSFLLSGWKMIVSRR